MFNSLQFNCYRLNLEMYDVLWPGSAVLVLDNLGSKFDICETAVFSANRMFVNGS